MSWWSAPNSKHAFILACASSISTTLAAIFGLTLYWISDSPLCLVYGLENCVDLVSDMVVLWRFYCPADVNPDVEELLKKREKRASIAISVVLALLGLDIIITSLHDLMKGRERLEENGSIIIISAFSLVVFGILTVFKLRYAMLLQSSSLQKDGICTLIGTILSLGLLVDAIIVRLYPDAWWFDPTVAFGCGVASFVIGAQAIFVARFVHKLPIFRPSWWLTSRGEGASKEEERKGSSLENGNASAGSTEMTSDQTPTKAALV